MAATRADDSDATRQFWRAFLGLTLTLLGLALWTHRDGISLWFARSYTTSVGFMVQNAGDELRLQRAFAAVQSARPDGAMLEPEPGSHHFYNVQVIGASRGAVVAEAETLSKAVVAAFNATGSDTLGVDVRRRGHSVPDMTTRSIESALAYAGAALALAGIALLWSGWRDWPAGARIYYGMPRAAAFGGLGIMAFGVLPLVIPGWVFVALFATAIPGVIAGKIAYTTWKIQRMGRWPSTQGRIVEARVKASRRTGAEGDTTVGNLADVAYAYSVDGVEYRGNRICLVAASPNSAEVEAELERYRVGRAVPVIYNPDRPEDAVLENALPFRAAAMYAIATGVLLAGLAIVVAFTQASLIFNWLQPFFPEGAVVPAVLFCALAGLLLTLSLISDLLSARAAARWVTVKGVILSSTAASHRMMVNAGTMSGGPRVVVWLPAIEYSYRVQGCDHYGSRLAFGATVSGSRAYAESIVARYPVGADVTVHSDPANPSVAVLETRVRFAWQTGLIAIAFFAAAAFFSSGRGLI